MRNLIPMVEGWRWLHFTRARLRPWLAQKKVYVTPAKGEPHGWALTNQDEEGFSVLLIVGKTREASDILADMGRLAHQRGQDKYWLILPTTAYTTAWAKASGWGPQTGGMLLYESSLD